MESSTAEAPPRMFSIACPENLRHMHMGFSKSGKRFLGTLTPDGVRSLYASFDAMPEKVADLVENVFDEDEELNPRECAIVNYLSSYKREMGVSMLHKFLASSSWNPAQQRRLFLFSTCHRMASIACPENLRRNLINLA